MQNNVKEEGKIYTKKKKINKFIETNYRTIKKKKKRK